MKTLISTLIILISVVHINSQTNWNKYPGNPIISGTPGTWDEAFVSFSTVIYDTVYKMWYSGGLDWNNFTDTKIGYAWSADGINWIKHPDPVLIKGDPGKFDEGMVACASVIFDEGKYKMWYIGTHSGVTSSWRIGYATSMDGKVWERQNNGDPVLDLGSFFEWNDNRIGHPTVIRDGAELKIWFYGARISDNGSIGFAISSDGINWTKYNDPSTPAPYAESDPVLTGTYQTWDQFIQQQPNVILHNSKYEMWYVAQGSGFNGQNMGYASSTDGINWNKPQPSPVMLRGFTGEFDYPYVLAPSVILGTDSIYRLWYTGSNLSTWQIGFATDSSLVNPVSINEEVNLPIEFTLHQNYPNPFNPTTTINWQIPVGSHQTLKVYDLLGREVATLVDEFKPAGSYEVEFNASKLSSGAYFYRLQAGEFSETKKLLLLK